MPTIPQHLKALSPEKLRKIESLIVRECDETSKGQFVAFVAEGGQDYDVAISLSPKGEILSHSCDCTDPEPICRHKSALMLYIQKGQPKKGVKPALVKKKSNPILDLLGEIEEKELRNWLGEFLVSHKEMELLFSNRFSKTTHIYTPEEAIKITEDAVKSVINKKRKIDQSELKKVLQLWKTVHQPILDYYLMAVEKEDHFNVFHALFCSCFDFARRINISNKKLSDYLSELLSVSVANKNNLNDQSAWLASVRFFTNKLTIKDCDYYHRYLSHLHEVFTGTREDRKKILLHLVMDTFTLFKTTNPYHFTDFMKVAFAMVSEANQFVEYQTHFTPSRYENDYNSDLIDSLIDWVN
jgi:hypothetical protein